MTSNTIACIHCGAREGSGLQVGLFWFDDNQIDEASLLEEGNVARYFNRLTCSSCGEEMLENPTSYFFNIGKTCDQHESDEQLPLIRKSLEHLGWNGEALYMIVNDGYFVFSEDGELVDLSALSGHQISASEVENAKGYSGGKVVKDKVYALKELSEDIVIQ